MTLTDGVVSGVAATALLDLWQRLLWWRLDIPPTGWALVGRWFRSAIRGRVFPGPAAQLPSGNGELALGWGVHYAVGVGYGVVYAVGLPMMGLDPTSWTVGLSFGVASVVVPWFFFMPAMGAGVLACRAPKPALARTLALAAHAVFGVGLWLGTLGARGIAAP